MVRRPESLLIVTIALLRIMGGLLYTVKNGRITNLL